MPAEAPRRIWWKIARLFVLAALICVALLMVRKPKPVAESMPGSIVRQKLEQVDTKLQDLENSRRRGETAQAQFNSEEINALLQQQTAAPVSDSEKPMESNVGTERPPGVKTAQVSLHGDEVTGQFVAVVQGVDVYLTVSGRIGASNGYITFEPTALKIGDMPVPVSLVNSQLQAKLRDNRDKLKLPEYISDLRVENGQMVMVAK
jgi:hypothetical protein